jgi:hypothetical protein
LHIEIKYRHFSPRHLSGSKYLYSPHKYSASVVQLVVNTNTVLNLCNHMISLIISSTTDLCILLVWIVKIHWSRNVCDFIYLNFKGVRWVLKTKWLLISGFYTSSSGIALIFFFTNLFFLHIVWTFFY